MYKDTAITPSVWTSDPGTMAQETAKYRWPRLVQGMVDDVFETSTELPPSPALDEIKSIQTKLHNLKDEIIADGELR